MNKTGKEMLEGQEARSIAHFDLDTFFVSVERLLDSRLQGRPILIGGTSDRGVVASCSYEARKFGIHSGMAMKMARNLCPEAVVIRGNTANYTKYSKLVTDIVQQEVPLFEKTSIDEFYVDLTGMDRFFGCYKLAGELRQKVMRETGLPISFGMSVNKTVSKVATGEAKPNNQLQVLQVIGDAFDFLVAVQPHADAAVAGLQRMIVLQPQAQRNNDVITVVQAVKAGVSRQQVPVLVDHLTVLNYSLHTRAP